MGSWNRWILDLSPWAFAAFWASVMASGSIVGRVLGGWAAGDVRLLDVLLTSGASALLLFPVVRLTAPAALRAMRRRELWREERRQQRS